MAEATKYTLEEIIALPIGTTPWYEQNQDAYRHIKNWTDFVSALAGGGEPGFGAPIDVRWYVQDTSGSSTNYVGVTRPAAEPGDILVRGHTIILDAEFGNTGACTLDIGLDVGPIEIKQFGQPDPNQDQYGKLDCEPGTVYGPTLMVYDGEHWVCDKSAARGAQGEQGIDGKPGIGIYFLGALPTQDDLPGWPDSYDGNVGDAYLMLDSGDFWVWTAHDGWLNIGHFPEVIPPYNLSLNALKDIGDVAESLAGENDLLTWKQGQWIGNKLTSDSVSEQFKADFIEDANNAFEAPNDGKQYVRQNESWQEIDVPPATPVGTISMWSGNTSSDLVTLQNANWFLCDGGVHAGSAGHSRAGIVPDLRGKFVKGGEVGLNVGMTGGSNTTDSTALTLDQTPVHSHSGSVSVSAHKHGPQTAESGGWIKKDRQVGIGSKYNTYEGAASSFSANTWGTGGWYTDGQAPGGSVTINNAGTGEAHSHTYDPAHMVLAYIIFLGESA